MFNNDITIFAETTFRNRSRKFGIKTDDRRRHMYLIGKTGMGKTTVLENMIIGDIRAGRGVAVVDPHGDLAEKVMQFIPEERVKDVVYFNPADIEYPIAFNIVEEVDIRVRHLVASGLVGVFKKLWADSWGPRLEYILRNAILAILDYPGATLLDVVRILSDKPYRKKVVSQVKDPVVKFFWQKEFAGYADKFAAEAVSPIQNKVGQFLSSAMIRNVVGQLKSSINMREIMDSGKILIMNLSKGRIGEDNSALMGAMMITKIQLAAMSRVEIPEEERKDFYLYIDEFQNFSTESFANILSEARKYRLNLIIAHQYIEQLDEKVKPAVFGNVGTIISFRVGAADAEEIVKEYTPVFMEEDIVNLPKFEFYLKLMIDGIASDPFSARGLPPLSENEKTNNFEKVISCSRQLYSRNRVEVEEAIMQSHFREEYSAKQVEDKKETVFRPAKPAESNYSGEEKFSFSKIEPTNPEMKENSEAKKYSEMKENPEAKKYSEMKENPEAKKYSEMKEEKFSNREKQKGFPAKCSFCGCDTKIPFVPDGVRPVYCKNCLSELKKQKKEKFEAIKRSGEEKIGLNALSPSELIKKENFEKNEETRGGEETENEKTISLSDIENEKTIDFFGRAKKNNSSADESARGEKDLEEGDDISFE